MTEPLPKETRTSRASRLGLLATLALACSLPAAADIDVSNARLRALLPGQDKTAGYFDITNSGTRDITLVSARGPDIRTIELHTIIADGDVVRMRRLDAVTVAAGTTMRFRQGGMHLMRFGVAELREATTLELITETGTTIPATFERIPIGQF